MLEGIKTESSRKGLIEGRMRKKVKSPRRLLDSSSFWPCPGWTGGRRRRQEALSWIYPGNSNSLCKWRDLDIL